MALKIGELLLEEGKITPQQLDQALAHQRSSGGRLGRALVQLGHLSDEDIASAIARRYDLDRVDLRDFTADPAMLGMIPAQTARRYQVLPLSVSDKAIRVAMADPTNVIAMDDIRAVTRRAVEPVAASEGALAEMIDKSYGPPPPREPRREAAPAGPIEESHGGGPVSAHQAPDPPNLTLDDMAAIGGLSEIDVDAIGEADPAEEDQSELDLGALSRSADASPVVKLANVLLVDSLKRRASHIFVEPYEKEFRVRFRIDGILYNVMALPMKLREPMTSRLKTMAKMDLSEKRLPQSGSIRIRLQVGDRRREISYHVSVVPSLWGETIVLKVLDRALLLLDKASLGFEPDPLEAFERALGETHGLVLVVGPARSGRTHTLYCALAGLNHPDRHLLAVEEEAGFSLPGVNQIRLRPAAGLTLPEVMRVLPRYDPDVVLVDRIRGREAAEAVVHAAARCGPLVLASLDEADAPAAVATLADASGESYLLGRALRLVVAQRLVPRLCGGCRVEGVDEREEEALRQLGLDGSERRGRASHRGRGCRDCGGTGFAGRTGLFEVLEAGQPLRDLIRRGSTEAEIRSRALEDHALFTLRMSGIEKIRQGVAAASDVLSATAP